MAANDLPRTGGHPFYQRLNAILDAHGFDDFVEAQCAAFYATHGRPSLTPGTHVRLLLIGYFEGIDSERGIAWRTANSPALRGFLGLGLEEMPPEHSTMSRTRRLIDLKTHRAVFTGVRLIKDVFQGFRPGLPRNEKPSRPVDLALAALAANPLSHVGSSARQFWRN